MLQSATIRSRGITVLEILIALAVLAVIVSFASNSFGTLANKAEFQAAVEGVNLSIQSARSTARTRETDVIMHLHSGHPKQQDSISFSFPGRNAESSSNALPQGFQLPVDVRLVANESSVHFDNRGLVETPVRLLLVSTVDENVKEKVLIE